MKIGKVEKLIFGVVNRMYNSNSKKRANRDRKFSLLILNTKNRQGKKESQNSLLRKIIQNPLISLKESMRVKRPN